MAIAYVGGGLLAGGNPIQVNYVSTGGNLLVAGCYTFSITATFAVTDSIGGTWTAGPVLTTTNARTQLFYKENSAPVAWVKVTITNSGGTPRLVVGEFSGVKTSGALENTKTNFGSVSNASSGAYTVTSGDLIVGFEAITSGGSPTAGAGFTAPVEVRDSVVCVEYQVIASTSANAAFVHAFSEYSLTSMAFLPEPGGGGGTGGGGFGPWITTGIGDYDMADISKQRITTATTTVIKATPGQFYGLIIGSMVASGVVEVYDAASVTGTPVLMVTTPGTVLHSQCFMVLPHPIRMSVGITIRTLTAAQDVTALWN